MPQIGEELASLNFEALVGGPLTAVVEAQAQAAITAVNFINEVGFDEIPPEERAPNGPSRRPQMVTFEYKRMVQVPDQEEPQLRDFELTVPLLAMVNVPYLRIETTDIEFNAKITSMVHSEESLQRRFDLDFQARAKFIFGRARLKAKYASTRNTVDTSRTNRNYDMKVHVHAVGDEMPAGTDRLLRILESTIDERLVA